MNSRLVFCLATTLSYAFVDRSAQAQQQTIPIPASQSPLPGGDQWHQHNEGSEPQLGYSLQILAADVAALSLGAVIAGNYAKEAWLLPFATFSPMVHFAHGNPGRGLVSLALHAALPYGGAYGLLYGGRSACEGMDGTCEGFNFVFGGAFGIAAATLVDTLFLAKAPRKPRPTHWRYALAPTVSITPHGGASVGLMGTI